MRFLFIFVRSLWNLTGTPGTLLTTFLSNVRTILWFNLTISRIQDFTGSYDETSYRILKQNSAVIIRDKLITILLESLMNDRTRTTVPNVITNSCLNFTGSLSKSWFIIGHGSIYIPKSYIMWLIKVVPGDEFVGKKELASYQIRIECHIFSSSTLWKTLYQSICF